MEPQVKVFTDYLVNRNRVGDNVQVTEQAEILIFDTNINQCAEFVVGRYIGLKYARPMESMGKSVSSSTYRNDEQALGFHPNGRIKCGQDHIISTATSGFMQITFDNVDLNHSDFNVVDKDEYIIFGHDNTDYMLSRSTDFIDASLVTTRTWMFESEKRIIKQY